MEVSSNKTLKSPIKRKLSYEKSGWFKIEFLCGLHDPFKGERKKFSKT